ncbi:MAG TPA: hypothetical protein VK857_00925 [Desulforhopalus sp.]|jgi:hypothetical protein|nr:hypothetical protein [Desulforhopalus sp.]
MKTILRNTLRILHQRRSLLLILGGCCTLLTAGEGICQGHPYLPLTQGATKVVSYRFSVEDATITPPPEKVRGEITMHTDRFEEKAGKRYLRQVTSYRDIPYFSEEQRLWRREEKGNVYLGAMLNGQWSETLELPGDTEIGREWDYFDGAPSKRRINGKVDLTMENGTVLKDCLEVSRVVIGNDLLKDAVNITYYCRDIGDAGTLFRQPTPIGTYTTETRLQSYKPPSP